ncbi:MAG: TIGR04255 family protein [Nitrospinae bacterium]|nr:TIGR04255 family protein [Nitrospinota bacterium]
MFNFPSNKRGKNFKFKKNLLKSVIFQLKYDVTGAVIPRSKEIHDRLKNKFPIINPIMESQTSIQISKDKTPIIQPITNTKKGLELKTEDNTKIFSITDDTFTYTIFGTVYENFDNAFSEIREDFFPILEESNISNFNRIAIRKINLMEREDSKVSSDHELLLLAFRENLINCFISIPDTKSMVSGVTSIKMEKENKRLNISYGIIPPSPKKENKQLLLDIDLFFINQGIAIESVESKWEEINNEIFNIFIWAISDKLRRSLDE